MAVRIAVGFSSNYKRIIKRASDKQEGNDNEENNEHAEEEHQG